MSRQLLVAGYGFINETGRKDFLIPGFGFIDETGNNTFNIPISEQIDMSVAYGIANSLGLSVSESVTADFIYNQTIRYHTALFVGTNGLFLREDSAKQYFMPGVGYISATGDSTIYPNVYNIITTSHDVSLTPSESFTYGLILAAAVQFLMNAPDLPSLDSGGTDTLGEIVFGDDTFGGESLVAAISNWWRVDYNPRISFSTLAPDLPVSTTDTGDTFTYGDSIFGDVLFGADDSIYVTVGAVPTKVDWADVHLASVSTNFTIGLIGSFNVSFNEDITARFSASSYHTSIALFASVNFVTDIFPRHFVTYSPDNS